MNSQTLRMLVGNSRLRIAFVLAVIWVVYNIFNFSLPTFLLPLLPVLLVASFDLVITYIRKRKLYFPASSFVTGFLIGLILSPTEDKSVISLIVAAILAVLSKQFLGKGEHKHIFNPAAFGILATALILGVPVAWWAVSWNSWIILVIMGVSLTLYRLNRLWLPVTFLITYAVYLFVKIHEITIAPLLFDGTAFLFAFVMLPEPITSPNVGWWKYGFGPFIVLLTIILGKLGFLPDVFLPALLVGNLIWFFQKQR